jgi:hypothetical protein
LSELDYFCRAIDAFLPEEDQVTRNNRLIVLGQLAACRRSLCYEIVPNSYIKLAFGLVLRGTFPIHVLAARICDPDDLTQRRNPFGKTSKGQRTSSSNHALCLCLFKKLASDIVVLVERD